MSHNIHNHHDEHHDHDLHHDHDHSHSKSNELTLAFWLNLLFSIIEVVGGFFTNSTAIIADAFHDFTDAIAIGIAVLLEKISDKKRTTGFSYGYKRFSLLAALGMSVFLLVGAIWMVNSAVNSFIEPKEVNSIGMLWLAVLGVAINGFAFLRIKKGDTGHHHHHHSHSNGHSHNHNSKAIMLHLLEDVLGWAAVLLGAGIIYFTGWNWVDGVLTLMIAIFVGYNATRNLIGTMKVLLQSVPENVIVEKLSAELNHIKGVEDIHDLHIWSLDGGYIICSLHAVVPTDDTNEVADTLSTILKLMEKYQIHHPTVQIEKTTRDCKLVTC